MQEPSADAVADTTARFRRRTSFVLQNPQKNDSFGPGDKARPDGSADLTEAATNSERTEPYPTTSTNNEQRSRSTSQDTAPSLKPSARRPLEKTDDPAITTPREAHVREVVQDQPTAGSGKGAQYGEAFCVIEDWHAVLGDKQSSGRSTTATRILRNVKQEFKQQKNGRHGVRWFAAAIDEYHRRLAKQFPDLSSNDRGLVLVQCSQHVIDSDRVTEPFSYGYQCKEALYGPAKVPEAIYFFFKSKDPPVLEKEVHKCRDGLRLMRKNKKKRPAHDG